MPRRTPLAPHRVSGRLYVWSPYGERAHWYRNLVAHPIVTVQSSQGSWVARAARLEDGDEVRQVCEALRAFDARLMGRYLADEGIADTTADVVANRDRLHAVRLDPVASAGPAPLRADLAWVWVLPPILAFALGAIRRRRASQRAR